MWSVKSPGLVAANENVDPLEKIFRWRYARSRLCVFYIDYNDLIKTIKLHDYHSVYQGSPWIKGRLLGCVSGE